MILDVVAYSTCRLVSHLPTLEPSPAIADGLLECQQAPQYSSCYASAPNDVWSLGIILVNLTCGRNPWKRACMEDSTYRAYTRDPTFLSSILPISSQLETILGRIFERDPHKRTGLAELRQMIMDCPSFTSPVVDNNLTIRGSGSQEVLSHSYGSLSVGISYPVSANISSSSEPSLADSASERSSKSSWSSVSSRNGYAVHEEPHTVTNEPRPSQQPSTVTSASSGFFTGSFINNCCSYLCGPLIQNQTHPFIPQVPLVC